MLELTDEVPQYAAGFQAEDDLRDPDVRRRLREGLDAVAGSPSLVREAHTAVSSLSGGSSS